MKRGGKKRSLKHQLANCLFQYRNTPHSVTEVTPSELFLIRKPRQHVHIDHLLQTQCLKSEEAFDEVDLEELPAPMAVPVSVPSTPLPSPSTSVPANNLIRFQTLL